MARPTRKALVTVNGPYIVHAKNAATLGLFDLVWARAGRELLRQGKALQGLEAIQELLNKPADAPETPTQQRT
jgi:hypothetical protein